MKNYSRADRVGDLIKEVISEIIIKNIKDPTLDMVTISGVKMSKDLKHARVYFVTFKEKKKEDVIKGFKRASGYIKRELGQKINLRYLPTLEFIYDESFDYGARIDKVLKSVLIDNEPNYTST